MNALLHWLTAPEWALIVKALLHSLWQGAVIAAGLALLLRCVHSPTLRYRLTLGGLATVVASAVITWAVLTAPKADTSEFVAAPTQVSEPVPAPTGPVQRIIVAVDRKQAQPQPQWTAWLALAWLLGAAAMLGRASVKVAGAEQLRRSCRPLDDGRITKLVAEARRAVKLTRQVRVAVTEQITSPAVVGVLVPTLILPLSLITTLTPEQIRFVLLHELAHIRRGDYLANLFQLFAEALFFFNPAVWWLSHQIRREREACCDALAIELSGAPADYARTLVSVAETMLRPSPAAAPAFGGEREPSSLTDRVHRALVPDYRPALRLTWRTMLAALVLGGVLLGLLAVGARQTVAAALENAASDETRSLDPTNVSFPYIPVELKEDFLIVEEAALRQHLPEAADAVRPWVLDAAEIARLQPLLIRAGARAFCSAEPMSPQIASGMECRWRIGGVNLTNNSMSYLTAPLTSEGRTNTRVAGVYVVSLADVKGWTPMEFGILPRVEDGGIASTLRMAIGKNKQRAAVTIPSGGGLVWATPEGTTDKGVRQLIVLRHDIKPAAPGGSIAVTPLSLAPGPTPRTINVYGFAKQPVMVRSDGSYEWDGVKMDLTGLRQHLAILKESDAHSTVRIYVDKDASYKALDALLAELKEQGLTASAIFSGEAPQPPPNSDLFNRVFKISAPELARVTGNVGPVMTTNSLESARAFFAQAGVDVTAPGRAMFFKDTLGWLFVRATTTELETIERILTGRAKAAPNPKSATVDSKPITAPPMSLNPGARVTYSIFDVTTVTVLADGRFSYRRANLDLEGLRSRLIEWTNVIMNSRFAILTQSNAPAGSTSNAVALIKEFGATPDIETLIPPDFSSRWEPMTDTSKEGLALAGVMPTKPSPSVEPSRVFGSDDTNLFTRTFKVDPNSFVTGLETASGLKTTNLQERIRTFFTSVGVDLQPPKAVFFNDRQGGLFVRASLADLDIIEQAIQVLAAQPPQVNIRAKFVEVPMGNELGRLLGSLLPAATNIVSGGHDRQILTNGFAGILTAAQAKEVYKALEQTEGVELLTAPDVTTLSGRQAQLQVVDIRTIVTGATSIMTNGITTNQFQTSALPFGPVLDVIPHVAADGYTVQLTIIPTITEFLGYDRPEPAITDYARSNSLSTALPLPRFRVRQLTTSSQVWDGQTIVLGGFISEIVTRQPDGSETRKPDAQAAKKQLFVFVTPTIIDSAGNRVNIPADGIPRGP